MAISGLDHIKFALLQGDGEITPHQGLIFNDQDGFHNLSQLSAQTDGGFKLSIKTPGRQYRAAHFGGHAKTSPTRHLLEHSKYSSRISYYVLRSSHEQKERQNCRVD
jgi:hypothetical protein